MTLHACAATPATMVVRGPSLRPQTTVRESVDTLFCDLLR